MPSILYSLEKKKERKKGSSTEKSEGKKENMYKGTNKRSENMEEGKKIKKTVKGRRARVCSLTDGLLYPFWMSENITQYDSPTTDHKIIRFFKCAGGK